MLNEWSGGAAQQGEGGDLPHQTLTPVSPQLPHSLALLSTRTEENRQEEQDFWIYYLYFY